MRRVIVLTALAAMLVPAAEAAADSCIAQASGNWNANGTWTACGGSFPTAGDSASIGAFTVSVTANHAADSLTLASTGTISFASGQELTISGAFTASGGNDHRQRSSSTSSARSRRRPRPRCLTESANMSSSRTRRSRTARSGWRQRRRRPAARARRRPGHRRRQHIHHADHHQRRRRHHHLQIYATGRLIDRRDGVGTTFVISPIENDGEIRSEDGTLQISNSLIGDQSSGSYVATAGNTLNMASNNTVVSRAR